VLSIRVQNRVLSVLLLLSLLRVERRSDVRLRISDRLGGGARSSESYHCESECYLRGARYSTADDAGRPTAQRSGRAFGRRKPGKSHSGCESFSECCRQARGVASDYGAIKTLFEHVVGDTTEQCVLRLGLTLSWTSAKRSWAFPPDEGGTPLRRKTRTRPTCRTLRKPYTDITTTHTARCHKTTTANTLRRARRRKRKKGGRLRCLVSASRSRSSRSIYRNTTYAHYRERALLHDPFVHKSHALVCVAKW